MKTFADRPVSARSADALMPALAAWGAPEPARLESAECGTTLVWLMSWGRVSVRRGEDGSYEIETVSTGRSSAVNVMDPQTAAQRAAAAVAIR